MAQLTEAQRTHGVDTLMRERPLDVEASGYVKTELRAAFAALDDWLHANQAAINAVLPQPYRSAASTPDKAHLFIMVCRERYLGGV